MAQSPITRFLTERFITPVVQAQLPAVTKDTQAFAVGVIPQPNLSLRDTLGQLCWPSTPSMAQAWRSRASTARNQRWME